MHSVGWIDMLASFAYLIEKIYKGWAIVALVRWCVRLAMSCAFLKADIDFVNGCNGWILFHVTSYLIIYILQHDYQLTRQRWQILGGVSYIVYFGLHGEQTVVQIRTLYWIMIMYRKSYNTNKITRRHFRRNATSLCRIYDTMCN